MIGHMGCQYCVLVVDWSGRTSSTEASLYLFWPSEVPVLSALSLCYLFWPAGVAVEKLYINQIFK